MAEVSRENALIWMLLGFTDDKSTLVQVMAWCRQATSHYLSKCWPRSMLPYGVTRPQCVYPSWSREVQIISQGWWCRGQSQPSVITISLKITYLKISVISPWASELNNEFPFPRRPLSWTEYSWYSKDWRSNVLKSPVPEGFLIHKGASHVAASRRFVDYVVNNRSAFALRQWMRDIRAPEEHYFQSLNHNPLKGVPGAFTGRVNWWVHYEK